MFECDGRIFRFRCRKTKERERASGLELDPDHAFFLTGIDHKAARTRARKYSGSIAAVSRQILCVVDADGLVREIENDARFASRQQPLFRMCLRRALPIPEASNEIR